MDIVHNPVLYILPFTGPPIVQLPPVHYFSVGKTDFSLECIATNDPQSPNMLRFKWFKESTRIYDKQSGWTIAEYSYNKKFFSKLATVNRLNQQHNGTYTCSVYDSMITTDISQSTNVIVESKQLLHVT